VIDALILIFYYAVALAFMYWVRRGRKL